MAGSNIKWMEEFADPEEARLKKEDSSRSERKLWCAVLERAVADARGQNSADRETEFTKISRTLAARAWLAYEGGEVGSFLWVISILGMEGLASDIRRSV